MQRTQAAKWLAVGALAWAGIFVGAGAASAQDPTPTPAATVAPAQQSTPAPTAAPTAAPAATAAPAQAPAPTAAPAQAGSGSAVQGGNTSIGAGAASGPAAAQNGAAVNAGPSATGGFGGQSSQIGNNNVTVEQSADAKSGDAVAGSQVTGVVGGNATIQNQNASFGSVAVSGGAAASNVAAVGAGPQSSGVLGGSQQAGNNNVAVVQSSNTETGSAVAGSQVTGIVGGGASTVQNSNASFGPVAVSGAAVSQNVGLVRAGPTALFGQASQVGSNDAILRQSSHVESGDALAGAQTTGIVGGGGTVQGSNTSTFPVAVSGNAFAQNIGVATPGPISLGLFGPAQTSQLGSNRVLAVQELEAETGDAVAGGQVTGLTSQELGHLSAVQNQQASTVPIAVTGFAGASNVLVTGSGPTALGGFGVPQASQFGSNTVEAAQLTHVESGDAVAGGQVVGGVGGGGTTVQGSNTAFAPVAFSGPAIGVNAAQPSAGPAAVGVGGASVSQAGSNRTSLSQEVIAESGDAIAGGQVTGLVGGANTVQLQNASIGAIGVTGPALGANVATPAAGPVALALGGPASAQQLGGNVAELAQFADASSGDAVSGGQVVGIAGGFGSRIQGSNASLFSLAVTNLATSFNSATGGAGPVAVSLLGTGTVSQAGGNVGRLVQEAPAATGDAVSGGEVFGVA